MPKIVFEKEKEETLFPFPLYSLVCKPFLRFHPSLLPRPLLQSLIFPFSSSSSQRGTIPLPPPPFFLSLPHHAITGSSQAAPSLAKMKGGEEEENRRETGTQWRREGGGDTGKRRWRRKRRGGGRGYSGKKGKRMEAYQEKRRRRFLGLFNTMHVHAVHGGEIYCQETVAIFFFAREKERGRTPVCTHSAQSPPSPSIQGAANKLTISVNPPPPPPLTRRDCVCSPTTLLDPFFDD